MARRFMLTVPGLNVAPDWRAVHDRLLDDFPGITDVLATTMTATLLIVYAGDANVEDWLESISHAIRSRRLRAGHAARVSTHRRARGHEPAWGLGRPTTAPLPPAVPSPLHHATPPTKGTP